MIGSNVCSIAELRFRGCDLGGSTNITVSATESALKVRAFYNTINELVNVEIKADKPIQNVNIFDLNGKLVMTCDEGLGLSDVNFELNLATLKSGIYFLNINTILNVEIVKLVKV